MAIGMSRTVIKGYLKSVPLLADLPDEDIDLVVNQARDVSYRRGARVFEEGAAADCCYVLTSGRMRVALSTANGSEILLHVITPTTLVGEVALLDGAARSASLVAIDACHLIRIPAQAFEGLRRNATFEKRVVASVVATLRDSEERVRVIATFPSVNRVAWCLARIARHSGRRDGRAIVVPGTPHQELAEMAGCTRETVTRSLATLRRRKYVSWDASGIRLETDGLQRYLTTELIAAGERPGPVT